MKAPIFARKIILADMLPRRLARCHLRQSMPSLAKSRRYTLKRSTSSRKTDNITFNKIMLFCVRYNIVVVIIANRLQLDTKATNFVFLRGEHYKYYYVLSVALCNKIILSIFCLVHTWSLKSYVFVSLCNGFALPGVTKIIYIN